MKLYTDYKAPNPRRLNYFLAIKDIELETEIVSLNDNENLSEEFAKINPMRTLPTLVFENGEVLTDTIAICAYLERLYPEKPLFGKDEESFAQVLGFCHRIYCYGLDAVAEIFRNSTPFFKDRAMPIRTPLAQNPDLIERGKLRLIDFYKELDNHLRERAYIVGDQLTQADIDAWLVPSFAKWVKVNIPEECEALLAWQKRIGDQLPRYD
jgi:glutathione S-transferase